MTETINKTQRGERFITAARTVVQHRSVMMVCKNCGSLKTEIPSAVCEMTEIAEDVPRYLDNEPSIICQCQHTFTLLDTFTASAIVAIYDAVNSKNQEKLKTFSLTGLSNTCLKLISRK